jgi:hypothetical protein
MTTKASSITESRLRNSATITSLVRPLGPRSGQGWKTGNKAVALVDSVRVAPEKPAKAGARATPGVPNAISSIFLTTAVVRASDAPPGSWTETMT